MERLRSSNIEERLVALDQAASCGEAGLRLLAAALGSKSWRMQAKAYELLCRIQVKLAEQALQSPKLAIFEIPIAQNYAADYGDIYSLSSIPRDLGQLQSNRQIGFKEPLDPGIALEMALIPGGEYLMGASRSHLGEAIHESPQHTVQLPTFTIGRYPITQAQWLTTFSRNPSYFQGENLPVDSVSWEDAVEFCDRLSHKTKRSYRLPTEAEWEYACRAGSQTPFYFGEILEPELANYYATGVKSTTPVDQFPANGFGLHDMHGNVREWCLDCWHSSYEGAPTDGSAWQGGNSKDRVLRGGSWFLSADCCTSSARISSQRDNRSYYYGFRVVCEWS
ncbi:Sulphatase-modifying factor protein [Thalassoporum mexicanum PCC 7367]|nr:Sulphatase-modifying factor protein [Pseudanabaena sp. PCC 7367]